MFSNPIDYFCGCSHRLANPVSEKPEYAPVVPDPFDVVRETDRIKAQDGWFQHWSVITDKGAKLKGGIMVRYRRGRAATTTYRDGVHVRGVHIGWLLSVQG